MVHISDPRLGLIRATQQYLREEGPQRCTDWVRPIIQSAPGFCDLFGVQDRMTY